MPVLDKVKLGFPPRPTTAGGLPSLGRRDIATPKLDGMRILIPRDHVAVYNRHGKPFTKMTDQSFLPEMHRYLCMHSDESVAWWDLEYLPGVNSAVIIDVCERTFERDYHARRRLMQNVFTEVCPRFTTITVPSQVSVFPVYYDEETAIHWYKLMEAHYKNIGKSYLWEGVVTVDTTLPYMLTRKQSMNMEMHMKYKFR